MNCEEFEERISAAVDRRLQRQEMQHFEEHARRCASCTRQYEDERSTKTFLVQHTRMVPVPADLQRSIATLIEREAGGAETPRSGLLRFMQAPLTRAAFAFGLTAVLLGAFLARYLEPTESSPIVTAGLGANNVVRQSVDDFHKILRGEIAPQRTSAESVDLQDFFSGQTSFPVLVPVMKECTLVGGVLQDYNGMRLAHVVYRAGDDLISVYQVCWETVQEGKALDLTPEAKAELLKGGWYTPYPAGNDAVVLWRHGRTLCVAVSHIALERLLASVRSGADSTLP